MENINFSFELNDELLQERKQVIEELKNEKIVRDFLIDHRLDASFLEKHATVFRQWVQRKKICDQCQGLKECLQEKEGYLKDLVMEDVLDVHLVACRYLKEKRRQEAYLDNIVVNHGNMEMKHQEFASIHLEEESAEYILCLKELLASIQKEQGIYLCGKPGVGKTYLMSCAANKFAHDGRKVAFINTAQLISELKMRMQDGTNDVYMNTLKKVDVLFVDDIGGENVTPWSRDEILMPLFNERMEKNRLTYFTSNYNFEELEDHFAIDAKGNKDVIKANRLLERIKALSDEKVLKGNNRRLKKSSQ